MLIPQELRYTKTHEWAKRQDGEIVVGMTAHAQEELRDVVYAEPPAVGKTLKQGDPAAIVESVKAAFDIYAPVSGTVTRVNAELAKTPQLINQDCYGKGWLFAITPLDSKEWEALLSAQGYQQMIQSTTTH